MKQNVFKFLFLLSFLISSCSKISTDVLDELEDGEVGFLGSTEVINENVDDANDRVDSNKTRGTIVTGNNTIPSMNVSAFLNNGTAWINKQTPIRNNNGVWRFVPTQYYPNDNSVLHFISYSPVSDSINGISNITKSYSSSGGKYGVLSMDYEVPTDCASQPDIMYAFGSGTNKSKFKEFSFRHALSTIAFSLKGYGNSIITKIEVKNVHTKGRLTVSERYPDQPSWVTTSEVGDFVAKIDANVMPDEHATQLTSSDGYLMMIPQEISVERTKFLVTIKNLDDNVSTVKELVPANDIRWYAGETYTYMIVLDGNLVIDFTNKEYVEELTGLPDNYGTVETSGLRTANSYIVNPRTDVALEVYIPVEERIDRFRKNYLGQTTIDFPSSDWTNLSGFGVQLLWSELDNSSLVGVEIEKAYSPSNKNAIKITIPKGYTKYQNISVAALRDGIVEWSWHIWITGYNPYVTSSGDRVPVATGTPSYTIPVPGGNVSRHSNSLWTTGQYRTKYAMDRNLGYISGASTPGSLYYQFGRKDPFPHCFFGRGYQSGQKTLQYTVNNPSQFIVSTTSGGIMSGFSNSDAINKMWYDKYIPASNVTRKSIFDPSPLGWRAPTRNTYSGVTLPNVGLIKWYKSKMSKYVNPSQSYYWSSNVASINSGGEVTARGETRELVFDIRPYLAHARPIRAVQE